MINRNLILMLMLSFIILYGCDDKEISEFPSEACYFAYGSNMDEEKMELRGAVFDEMIAAKAYDFRLTFNKIANLDMGIGYANIVPDKGSVVEGVLYHTDEESLLNLDRAEGVPTHYLRETIIVQDESENNFECFVYIANPESTKEGLKPTRGYLGSLLSGRYFLSEEYYGMLTQVETFD